MSHTDDADYTDNASLHSRGRQAADARGASVAQKRTLVLPRRAACCLFSSRMATHKCNACKNMSKFSFKFSLIIFINRLH